jgi:hypothetical protein
MRFGSENAVLAPSFGRRGNRLELLLRFDLARCRRWLEAQNPVLRKRLSDTGENQNGK